MELGNIKRRDWENNDIASPVLHFDLTMADIRDMLTSALQAKSEEERILHTSNALQYVRGLQDGNRFMRQKPPMITATTTQ